MGRSRQPDLLLENNGAYRSRLLKWRGPYITHVFPPTPHPPLPASTSGATQATQLAGTDTWRSLHAKGRAAIQADGSAIIGAHTVADAPGPHSERVARYTPRSRANRFQLRKPGSSFPPWRLHTRSPRCRWRLRLLRTSG